MGKAKRVLRCHSCGAILQCDDKNETGYISKEILETNPKIPYCNSCYKKMIEINASELKEDVENDILKILNDAVATDALIIWAVDLFSFNGNLNHKIANKIKKSNVLVVGTKKDLFKKYVSDESLKAFLNSTFQEVGIKPIEIVLFDNEMDYDFASIQVELKQMRQGHDVFMIGNYLSGRTTLINRFLKTYKNNSKRNICTMVYPHTNAMVLEVPLSSSSFFYELPDLPLETSVIARVEKDLLKYIVPHKEILLTKKALDEGETIALGNLGAYSLIKGGSTQFKIYSAEGCEFKKFKTSKLDEFTVENLRKKHTRPVSERYKSFVDYDVFDYEMENDGKLHDIGIEGLCWASFIAKGQIIRVYAPKGTALKETFSKVNNNVNRKTKKTIKKRRK